MNISRIYSAQLFGLSTHIIDIEVDLSNGLHSFTIIGLGDKAIDESKDRISSAIKNTGYTSPKQKNQKVVISLAPADIRKEGPSFDLGMALAYLCASGDIDFNPEKKIFLGELSLEGKVRRINGVLPLVLGSIKHGYSEIFLPKENASEAGLIKGITIYPVENLNQIIKHLSNKNGESIKPQNPTQITQTKEVGMNDFSMIQGQETAKRALEIAAAGCHNIAMYGPPGTGKTMLAKSFPTILPSLTYDEIIEVTSINSIANNLDRPFITRPPFRSPHHTASYTSIVGGGSFPKPGEISLAHRGVLFLDELPEFDKKVIESLRQPLEDRSITISRSKGALTFPAQCILIASMNPCPCGYGKDRKCTCSNIEITNYNKRISGPIVDRIDMWVSVSKIDYDKLSQRSFSNENSMIIQSRVESARKIQKQRFDFYKINNKKFNSEMDISDIEKCTNIKPEVLDLLKSSSKKLSISARGYHRIIKLSRTIADLDGEKDIENKHILEAIQYRQKNF